MTDSLTRYADELRGEARRLTNELAKLRGGKMINDATKNCAWKCADDARDCICRNEYRATVQPALIAQYDAIVAAVIRACPVVVQLETYDMYNSILTAITQHDPRKGAE